MYQVHLHSIRAPLIPMAEVADDDGHSMTKFITGNIVIKRGESKDIKLHYCAYLIKIPDIPDGDNILMQHI